jgi:two-component system cell cycle sensor histidine kinase/response regulator CckA
MEGILLVDDDATVRGLCQRILELGGYRVMSAASGEEAIRVAKNANHVIDLALIDVIMPGMNGMEVADRLRAMDLDPSPRIVLMTGYSLREIANIVGENNPHRIIWKPFKADSLLRMIENALGGNDSPSL